MVHESGRLHTNDQINWLSHTVEAQSEPPKLSSLYPDPYMEEMELQYVRMRNIYRFDHEEPSTGHNAPDSMPCQAIRQARPLRGFANDQMTAQAAIMQVTKHVHTK